MKPTGDCKTGPVSGPHQHAVLGAGADIILLLDYRLYRSVHRRACPLQRASNKRSFTFQRPLVSVSVITRSTP